MHERPTVVGHGETLQTDEEGVRNEEQYIIDAAMCSKAHKGDVSRENEPYIKEYIIAVPPAVVVGEKDEHYH